MSHALWKASGAAHRPTRNSCFSLAFWLSRHDEQWQSLDPPRPIRLDLPYSSFCLGISLPHCPPRRKEWRVLSAAGSLNSSYKLEYLFMSSFLCDIRLLQPSAPPYLLQQTLNHFGVWKTDLTHFASSVRWIFSEPRLLEFKPSLHS